MSISAFGSAHVMWGIIFLAGIFDLRFIPIAVQGLHSVDLIIIINVWSSAMCSQTNHNQISGWLGCKLSISASRKTLGIAIFSPVQMQPEHT